MTQTGAVPGVTVRHSPFAIWADAGWQRVRLAFGPVLQACVAAAIAYNIGIHVLGHQTPFFAAIAAWMCLGWSFERDIRRVAEIAIGVTLGVTFGDIVVATIGSGWWQLSTVLLVAALSARFVDSGGLLATQAGAQAIVIAGLPNIVGGPYGRAIDAAVGGLIALIFTILTPYRPGKTTRKNSAAAASALSTTAAMLASGLRAGSPEAMESALAAARQTEPLLNTAVDRSRVARRQARWTINRRHESQWAQVQHRDSMLERAMRSLRVLARRLRFDAGEAAETDRNWLAGILARYSSACLTLAETIRNGAALELDRAELSKIAHDLTAYHPNDPAIATGAAVFRAVIVDTLQAAGATPEQANVALVP